MITRMTKVDMDYLCEVSLDLAYIAQRINRQIDTYGKPGPGKTALPKFKMISRERIAGLRDIGGFRVEKLLACYDEVICSESAGWTTKVFEQYWNPNAYDSVTHDPTESMDLRQWGFVKGSTDYVVSDDYASTVPASWVTANRGQMRTMLDVAETLNSAYHFKKREDFSQAFLDATLHNIKRGSISNTAFELFNGIVSANADSLFGSNGLDSKRLGRLVEEAIHPGFDSPIEYLLVKAVQSFILRVVVSVNEIMRYEARGIFMEDVRLVFGDRVDNMPLFDMGNVCHFTGAVSNNWDSLLECGTLSCAKVEKYFFGQHEARMSKYGLDGVLERFYHKVVDVDGDQWMEPNKPWNGPTYVEDQFWVDHCSGRKRYIKSCTTGGCGSKLYPGQQEFSLLRPILDREVDAGNYVKVDRYYLPSHDDSLPIFHEDYGKVCFDSVHFQRVFLNQWRETKQIPQL